MVWHTFAIVIINDFEGLAFGIGRALMGVQEGMKMLNEDQIERQVEWAMNRLDRKFMNSDMSQEEYDKAVKELDTWANQQYDMIVNCF